MTEELRSKAGYPIDYEDQVPAGASRIVIALHGISGSKRSRAITMLQDREVARGNGLVKFDWPAHGDSQAHDCDLLISNCLSDLDTVIAHVKKLYPSASLAAFATSFGGYIAMLYAAHHPDDFDRIVLRSPALRFYDVLQESILDDAARTQLSREGCFTTGFDRKMDVPAAFLKEAEAYQVEGCESISDKVTIIHGDRDEVVPYEHSEGFCKSWNIPLFTVHGANHWYAGEGLLEKAIDFAVDRIG